MRPRDVQPLACHDRAVCTTGSGSAFSTLSSVSPELTEFTVVEWGARMDQV
jgi:hypothetical protein